jgi:hypothetical protein
MAVVFAAGMRYSGPSRRGRALFLFTIGIALMVLASGFFVVRALSATEFIGVGTTVTVLAFAMLVVATGALLPTVEDWFGARRELHIIDPLLRELGRRQPDVGIGVRPRGPLTFRVAERMSLISDALFLEATDAAGNEVSSGARAERSHNTAGGVEPQRLIEDVDAPAVAARAQARAIANWIRRTDKTGGRFPGSAGYASQKTTRTGSGSWLLRRSTANSRTRSIATATHDDDSPGAALTPERPKSRGAPGDGARRPSRQGHPGPRATARRFAPQYAAHPRRAYWRARSAPCRASRNSRRR